MDGLRLVDTHAHLDEFPGLDSAVEHAKEVGVAAIIAVGTGRTSNEKTLRLSRSYSGYVFPALGIHPSEVKQDMEVEIGLIEKELDGCVAVGEVGLDYWAEKDKEVQRSVFKRLLELAAKRGKPVSLHSRGAWEDAYRIVRESGVRKAVFHWYSGPLELLSSILDSGYLVSATPAAEYSKAHREAVKKTPLESLLLETDSPVKYRGVEAEPSTVLKTLMYVADLKNVPGEVISERTTENAIELFHLNI